MKVARYVGDGRVKIVDEPIPKCPEGGLLVQTEACGLCSGELMAWYMDRKIPHVLGHEVCGTVLESKCERHPVGSRVFPHHHSPCMRCDMCLSGRHVHCAQWKRTKLVPGGMAEFFAVPFENLSDTLDIGTTPAADAALIEPLACVLKSLRCVDLTPGSSFEQVSAEPNTRRTIDGAVGRRVAVVGLGAMGLMHMLALDRARGYDMNPRRVQHASSIGLDAAAPDDSRAADTVFVCPGSQAAFEFALTIAAPRAGIVMFAPLAPGDDLRIPQSVYFNDIRIFNSYSCSIEETTRALNLIERGTVGARHLVDRYIRIIELPEAYQAMKRGEILKPMVVFS